MREVNVGHASDFADPGRKIIGFERFEIVVFKLGGEFFAYLNHCPHMGGPRAKLRPVKVAVSGGDVIVTAPDERESVPVMAADLSLL